MSRYELNYNNSKLKERRRILRNNMTKAEVILWECIRRRQIKNIKFRRQFSIESFVVDFFSTELMLSLEVDGPTHYTKDEIENDKNRQDFLQNYGIKFLRFTNEEIYDSIDSVIVKISNKIDELMKT